MQRIALLLIVLLAGCASGDTTDSPTTTQAVTTTTATSSSSTTTTEPPATTTTTAATTTTTDAATTDPKASATFPGAGDTAFLTAVDVSENAVVDFAFEGEVVPAYRVAYVEPPIVADGSGMELDLDGEAFLEVVVSPGAGVDLSGEEPRETFTGEDRFTVDSVDGIVELVENGDFESVLTWTIGLTARHPFSVDARPGSLTIDLEVPDDTTASLLGAEPATCTSADGFTVSYPSDWWASTGELACGSFAPTELDLAPNTDVTAPVMIFADPVEIRDRRLAEPIT